jgi:hypothetical protein
MKTNLTNLPLFTKLTITGLVACAIALWMQWLSGDPAYPKFPPGPVVFIAVAAIVAFAARWWWTPLIGALIALLVTSGWFARLPAAMQRLTHPGSVGKFAAGIFVGAVLQIAALLLADIAGLAATVQNYRRMGNTTDSSKILLRLFGGLFVLMAILVMVSGLHTDRYHNLMHLTWGLLAVGTSFLGATAAKRFCFGSGVFYIALAILGLAIGDSAMNRAWYAGPMLLHTGDHIFHLVLGSVFLGISQLPVRQQHYEQSHA